MKNLFNIYILSLILLSFIINQTAANHFNNKLTKEKIITDPQTGDKLICDELFVVFKDNVDPSEQAKILADIDAKIISEMPSLGICQISFNNPDTSIKRLQHLKQQLEMNENILYVRPQKVEIKKISISEVSPKHVKLTRKGKVKFNTTDLNHKNVHKKSMQDLISAHTAGLNVCVERERRLRKSFHGEIIFYIEYSGDGNVTHAKIIRSNYKDYKFTGCLLNKVKQWRNLPRNVSGKGSHVEFTFKF